VLLGSLAAVTCGGRSELVLPSSSSGATCFTFDGVYYMRDDGSGLRQLAPEGDIGIAGFLNADSLAIATHHGVPRAIAVDAKSVYWTTDAPASGVFRVRKPLAIETFRGR
jgi:hypothetical protein